MVWPGHGLAHLNTAMWFFSARIDKRGRKLEIFCLICLYWEWYRVYIKLYLDSIVCALLSLIKLVTISVPSYDIFLFLLPHLLLWLIRIFFNCVLPPCQLHWKRVFSCTLILCLALRRNLVNGMLAGIMQTKLEMAWHLSPVIAIERHFSG